MHDIETFSIDRLLQKEHFYGKIMQKIAPKAIPSHSKQPLHARNAFKNKIFCKRIIKKP